MRTKSILSVLLLSFLFLPITLIAQREADQGYGSITEAELREHIFFLASDSMGGRVATSSEYRIAARYVASQFVQAGLQPVADTDSLSFFLQGVPFRRTVYGNQFTWSVNSGDTQKELAHPDDFKVLMGSNYQFDNLGLVYVGYGIEEPDSDWNDFKDLDLTGKIVVFLNGAPRKNGKSVIKNDSRYRNQSGMYVKIFRGMANKGAAGYIMVDLDDASDTDFKEVKSAFVSNKPVFQAKQEAGPMRVSSCLFRARSEFLDLVMAGNPANPNNNPGNVLKNYKPQLLDATLSSKPEILDESMIYSNNVVGMVPGTDPVLKDEYIVVGAHLDHVRPRQGNVCNGADDNASGSAGVMEVAEAIAMNPCKRTVVFITYTAEEMGLIGSAYFIESGIIPKDRIKFNVNLDMIGRSGKDNEKSRAHYVITNKRYLEKVGAFFKDVNDGVTDFPIIFNDDAHSQGGSDHMSFMKAGIPAGFFFSGIYPDLHTPEDDPEKIDYPKAASITRLVYLITQKLGNIDKIPAFE